MCSERRDLRRQACCFGWNETARMYLINCHEPLHNVHSLRDNEVGITRARWDDLVTVSEITSQKKNKTFAATMTALGFRSFCSHTLRLLRPVITAARSTRKWTGSRDAARSQTPPHCSWTVMINWLFRFYWGMTTACSLGVHPTSKKRPRCSALTARFPLKTPACDHMSTSTWLSAKPSLVIERRRASVVIWGIVVP